MENYYTLLEVPHNANINQIRSAFRKKAKSCHPDLFQNVSEQELKKQQKMFVRLSQAYETLSNPKKRKLFDDQLRKSIRKSHLSNEQKKQRSSSFSSENGNLNRKNKFSKNSKNFSFSEQEDSLEDLIRDLEKMMVQFGIKFRDPLEMMVDWALKIFKELSIDKDEQPKNTKNKNHAKFKTSTKKPKEPLDTVEEELERLKNQLKTGSESSKSTKNNNFEDVVDQELRSIKKKYRI